MLSLNVLNDLYKRSLEPKRKPRVYRLTDVHVKSCKQSQTNSKNNMHLCVCGRSGSSLRAVSHERTSSL